MNDLPPQFEPPTQSVDDISEELLLLERLLKETLAKPNPLYQEEHQDGIEYLRINISELRRNLQEAILDQQFVDHISISDTIDRLRSHGFDIPDDNIEDYASTLECYSPGTRVRYLVSSSSTPLFGEVVSQPHFILAPAANNDALSCRVIADIEINTDGVNEYEGFSFHRSSSGQLKLIGISQI